MNDRIQITPAVLRAVADVHDEVAEQITTAQSASAEIQGAVASYGPIMHRVKPRPPPAEAARRRLGEHAATHRGAADVLRVQPPTSPAPTSSTRSGCDLTDEHAVPLSDQSFTAATPDGSVFVRVAVRGHVLGVQLEPEAMGRPGHEIAERIMGLCRRRVFSGTGGGAAPVGTGRHRDR